ncbi:MAG: carboxypeptidase regulatory-like domain-containing protein [Armatimonadetes bacterium]|nr:carboxypeptidase regulatory-like domain-containing protein [Armatimonadota bacterium]
MLLLAGRVGAEVVTGRVVDAHGRPVAGAEVYLRLWQPGAPAIEPCRTGSDGRWRHRIPPAGGQRSGYTVVVVSTSGLGWATSASAHEIALLPATSMVVRVVTAGPASRPAAQSWKLRRPVAWSVAGGWRPLGPAARGRRGRRR